jgi:uncharacterized protein (DUF1684 family)
MSRTAVLVGITIALLCTALAAELPYPEQIAKFRVEREQEIRADWLPLVGLYWLKEGDNAVGSNPKSEVVLPASSPALVGTLSFLQGKVLFKPAGAGVVKLKNGQQAKAAEVKDDIFTSGTVDFFLIRRGERVAVRVKDSASPALREFSHLQWFGVDASWRITAKFVPWDKPHKLTYDTVIPDLKEDYVSPGLVKFRKNNIEYTLEPVEEDGQYFYVFRDATSGKTTYPAARYLYSDPPKNGVLVLDFNTATSPPCAVTNFATCPLPPPRNRLALAITAGEMTHK